ncbi:MAG: hypothetical protein GY913_31855 [Proteobacteria bacterium]|nr:hypothetical protein [Pseudomonadota bacterium]MCP4921515.1 hypothetical protein [Pseudomonadota bacterium]
MFLSLLLPSALAANFDVDVLYDGVDATPGDGKCATQVGDCTLRAAVEEANGLTGHDTITLDSGVHTLTLTTQGDLDVTQDVDIFAFPTARPATAATR